MEPKPETNLTVGSSSVRLYNEMKGRTDVKILDPYVDGKEKVAALQDEPAVFFIGTKHAFFEDFAAAEGSIIVDPFGYIKPRDGVRVVSVGRQ